MSLEVVTAPDTSTPAIASPATETQGHQPLTSAELAAQLTAELNAFDAESNTDEPSTEVAATETVEQAAKEEPATPPEPVGLASKHAALLSRFQHLEASERTHKEAADKATARADALEAKLKDPFQALEAAGTDWHSLLTALKDGTLTPPDLKAATADYPEEIQELIREKKERAQNEAKAQELKARNDAFDNDSKEVAKVIKEHAEDYPYLEALGDDVAAAIVSQVYQHLEGNKTADIGEALHAVLKATNERAEAQARAFLKADKLRQRLLGTSDTTATDNINSADLKSVEQSQSNPEKQRAGTSGSQPTTLTNSLVTRVPSRNHTTQLTSAELAAQLNREMRGEQ